MHDRNHRLIGIYLNRRRRRARLRKDVEEVARIDAILNDDLALCALCCAIEDKCLDCANYGAAFPLLQWLLENWPAIMELIKTLIELFKAEPNT